MGVFYDKSESETTTGGVVVGSSDADGFTVGVRLVGENLSFAGEMSSSGETDSTGSKTDFDGQAANGAFQLGDTVAFGLGLEKNSLESGNTKFETSLMLAGASLRLGDIFFLGAAFGKQTIDVTVTTVSDQVELNERRFGIGIFDDEGVKWHIEYSVFFVDSLVKSAPIVLNFKEIEVANLEIEVNIDGFLFGIGASSSESTDNSVSPATTGEEDAIEVEVGWVPEEGLAVVLFFGRGEETEGGNVTDSDSIGLLLSLMF
ncbi:MAG: hypothetical protein O7A69_11065 [SAR324 cluster bacterium]|nr:hypothetical protein [SAR324 cluster bacterium]